MQISVCYFGTLLYIPSSWTVIVIAFSGIVHEIAYVISILPTQCIWSEFGRPSKSWRKGEKKYQRQKTIYLIDLSRLHYGECSVSDDRRMVQSNRFR